MLPKQSILHGSIYQGLQPFTCFHSNRVLIYTDWLCLWLELCLEFMFPALPGFSEAHPPEGSPHSVLDLGCQPQVHPRSGPLVNRFKPSVLFAVEGITCTDF